MMASKLLSINICCYFFYNSKVFPISFLVCKAFFLTHFDKTVPISFYPINFSILEMMNLEILDLGW